VHRLRHACGVARVQRRHEGGDVVDAAACAPRALAYPRDAHGGHAAHRLGGDQEDVVDARQIDQASCAAFVDDAAAQAEAARLLDELGGAGRRKDRGVAGERAAHLAFHVGDVGVGRVGEQDGGARQTRWLNAPAVRWQGGEEGDEQADALVRVASDRRSQRSQRTAGALSRAHHKEGQRDEHHSCCRTIPRRCATLGA